MWLSLVCLCMGFLNSLNIKVVLNIFQAVVRGLAFDLSPLAKTISTSNFKKQKKGNRGVVV